MRLIDCFMEMIAYTLYLVQNQDATQPAFDDVVAHYRLLLSRADKCRQEAGLTGKELKEGFFAVCAWIDETILCSQWSEKDKWQHIQLQRTYFNTTNAGEEFFLRLARLDKKEKDAWEVYEFCLALGFKGRYFPIAEKAKLEDIKLTHLRLLAKNTDLKFPKELFPSAYAWTSWAKIKRKKWRRSISPLNILLLLAPVASFVALYFYFKDLLDNMVVEYFISKGF